MAFQQVFRTGNSSRLSETIRIGGTFISFSEDIIADFKEIEYISVFVDYDTGELAFGKTDIPTINFKMIQKKKGIPIGRFFFKEIMIKKGSYKAKKEEETGRWIISNCLEKPTGKLKKESNGGMSHKKIEQDEISVVNSGFFFPSSVSSHPLMKGIVRMEKIVKENTNEYDLLLFKPTKNIIDGKKLTEGKGGTLYFFGKTSEYIVGRYHFEITKEGFLVKISKQ